MANELITGILKAQNKRAADVKATLAEIAKEDRKLKNALTEELGKEMIKKRVEQQFPDPLLNILGITEPSERDLSRYKPEIPPRAAVGRGEGGFVLPGKPPVEDIAKRIIGPEGFQIPKGYTGARTELGETPLISPKRILEADRPAFRKTRPGRYRRDIVEPARRRIGEFGLQPEVTEKGRVKLERPTVKAPTTADKVIGALARGKVIDPYTKELLPPRDRAQVEDSLASTLGIGWETKFPQALAILDRMFPDETGITTGVNDPLGLR